MIISMQTNFWSFFDEESWKKNREQGKKFQE